MAIPKYKQSISESESIQFVNHNGTSWKWMGRREALLGEKLCVVDQFPESRKRLKYGYCSRVQNSYWAIRNVGGGMFELTIFPRPSRLAMEKTVADGFDKIDWAVHLAIVKARIVHVRNLTDKFYSSATWPAHEMEHLAEVFEYLDRASREQTVCIDLLATRRSLKSVLDLWATVKEIQELKKENDQLKKELADLNDQPEAPCCVIPFRSRVAEIAQRLK